MKRGQDKEKSEAIEELMIVFLCCLLVYVGGLVICCGCKHEYIGTIFPLLATLISFFFFFFFFIVT